MSISCDLEWGLMFQVVAARYETGSIVISTNRVFNEWGQIFIVDNTLATAMIDRMMHHGETKRAARRWLRLLPGNRLEEHLGEPTQAGVEMLVNDAKRL